MVGSAVFVGSCCRGGGLAAAAPARRASAATAKTSVRSRRRVTPTTSAAPQRHATPRASDPERGIGPLRHRLGLPAWGSGRQHYNVTLASDARRGVLEIDSD